MTSDSIWIILCYSGTVSYTHLDVYKRQIEKKNIGEVEVKDNQIIFTDKDQKNIYKTGLMNDPNPVSYTHLDVYKRQEWDMLYILFPIREKGCSKAL